MPWKDALGNVAVGLVVRGVARPGRRSGGRGMASTGRAQGLRRPLPAPDVGRDAQTDGARPDADPGAADPPDGRAVLGLGHPDPAPDGEPTARAVVGRPQVGPVHHPRPGGGDLALRPGAPALGGAGGPADRRVRGSAAAAARRRRDPHDRRIPGLHRAIWSDLRAEVQRPTPMPSRAAVPSRRALLALQVGASSCSSCSARPDRDGRARPILLRPPAGGAGASLAGVCHRGVQGPRGHPHRDRAGVRDRAPSVGSCSGSGLRGRPRRGRVRPLRQDAERAAARRAGAYLRALARPWDLVQGGAWRHARLLHRVLQRLPGPGRR